MNLVGSYTSACYPSNTHFSAATHTHHDFYSASSPNNSSNSPHLQNMGMARYPWGPLSGHPADHHSSLVPELWANASHQHVPHSAQNLSPMSAPAGGVHSDAAPNIGLTANGITDFHAQYPITTGPNGYTNVPMYDVMPDGTIKVRVVKKRNSANKKERRRTISINTAFSSLRNCIPNVPSDTKLSKIKTLRLATSYIAYLMDILNTDDPTLTRGGFKAEIAKKIENREERRKREVEEMLRTEKKEEMKRNKGRTGWPQTVWASELKPETQSPEPVNGHHDNQPRNEHCTMDTET